ncbi:bile acid:sodium symporter family protein [Nocardioides speluncae]|uniref:bile acid:sodium symporter family protein n=1 Tax=Nocardioides speluncae TaxID=2670337 RepID=UPI000D6912A1|nr:bile acid:sodium symporter [Nocardioides speluncae]
MDTVILTVGIPLTLAVMMFGLGLDLTLGDFRDVWRRPQAALVTLILQIGILPGLCFGLIELFRLDPLLAVGMMLVAASPGGIMASVFSHLFRGDVALNVAVTIVNTLVAIFTWPLVMELAVNYYGVGADITVPVVEVLKVLLVVLVPVALGMLVRARESAWAKHRQRPFRSATLVAVALLVVAGVVDQRNNIVGYIEDAGLIVLVYAALSFALGFFLPLLLGVDRRRAVSCSMELGVHQSALALLIASQVIDNDRVAIPSALYSLFSLIMAGFWGLAIRGKRDAYVGRRRVEV